jgi:hypothetical protein
VDISGAPSDDLSFADRCLTIKAGLGRSPSDRYDVPPTDGEEQAGPEHRSQSGVVVTPGELLERVLQDKG